MAGRSEAAAAAAAKEWIKLDWKEAYGHLTCPDREVDVCFASPSPALGVAKALSGDERRRGSSPDRHHRRKLGTLRDDVDWCVGTRRTAAHGGDGALRPVTRAAAKASDGRGQDAHSTSKDVHDFSSDDEQEERVNNRFCSNLPPIQKNKYCKLPLNTFKSQGHAGKRDPISVDKMYSSQPSSTSLSAKRTHAIDPEVSDHEKCQNIEITLPRRFSKRRKEQVQNSSSVYSRKAQDVVLLDDEDMQSEEEVNCEMSDRRRKEQNSSSVYSRKGFGEAFLKRSALHGGVPLKILKHAKKPPPTSQEEDEAGDSGDASSARNLPPDDTADAGHNKRAMTLKRGPPPQQGEECPEKRAARSDGETIAVSVLQQLRKALTKTTSPLSSPDIAQEDEHYDREMAEQEQSNTSQPQDKHRACKEQQQEKRITEQDHDGDTSPPPDKDMRSAHGEEQQEEFANQEQADDNLPLKDNHSTDEEGQQGEGIPQQEGQQGEGIPTSRDFSVLSKLYPHLAKEVKSYAETHSSGDLIMEMFMTIGDEKACDLDAKCKKQHIEAFKLELGQASLTNELLSALSSLTTKITDLQPKATDNDPNSKLPSPSPDQGHYGGYCHLFPADSS